MNEITVKIPVRFNSTTINQVLNQIIDTDLTCSYDKVIFDLTSINFIDPGGVTVLTNLFKWLKKKSIKIRIVRNKQNIEVGSKNYKVMKYMEDCGFFKLHNFEDNIYGNSNLRPTTMPINIIKYKDYIQWNQNDFLLWLQKQTGSKSQFTNIQIAIQEIFNNISDHSTESIGCVFAQFYPYNKEISIALSDFGVGIPNSVRYLSPDCSDAELLEFSVQEGVSTQSTPGNRGAGLWNIIRGLTNSQIGEVFISSNYGRIWYSNKKVIKKKDEEAYYPGTFFEITIDITNPELYDIEEEEEFEW